jgi:hypothetical protein
LRIAFGKRGLPQSEVRAVGLLLVAPVITGVFF